MDDGETFRSVTTALEQCGYAVYHKVIFSDELVGVPQRRERLYCELQYERQSFLDFSIEDAERMENCP